MRKTLLNIGNSYLFTGIVVAIDKDFGYEVLDDEWSADDGTQPHAVTGVENEDYVIASSAQTVAYNPWGKVSGISEGDDLRNYMNYYNEFTDYDCNGNVTRLLRGGLTNNLNGTFGLVDNLWMTYEGNRLVSVRDSAFHFTYANATDFDGVRGQEYPLTYDNAGALVSDAGRGIARTDYDLCGNPVRIQFTDGSVTRYIYSAAGEKLRVTYLTAVPNITVPIGGTRELSPSEILSADSTDYLLGGTLTMRNGRIDKYLFDEGYCQAAKYASIPVQDTFTFYYFDRDHLGSVRQVVKADRNTNGTVVQRMEYYPSGLQFCDNTTDSDKQPQRYNGKELDKMHGLNTYDYGARQYNPVTARWDRMDPLCEKYYGVSPYAYCVGNPMNAVDADGNIVIPVHGTWSSSDTWGNLDGIINATNNLFGDNKRGHLFKWSGENSIEQRKIAAERLIEQIRQDLSGLDSSESITLVGHSHGGNVSIEAINMMMDMDEFKDRTFNLLTINTPVRDDYQLSKKAQEKVNHVIVYDPKDPVQICGGKTTFGGVSVEIGPAGRVFKKAKNIKVDNPQGIINCKRANNTYLIPGMTYYNPIEIVGIGDFHNSHNRVQDWIKYTR